MGRVTFIVFYLAGGVAAFALQTVVDPTADVPTLGASGAVAAVLGGYLLLYPRARVVSALFLLFFFTIIELPAVAVLALWFVQQLVFGALDFTTGGQSERRRGLLRAHRRLRVRPARDPHARLAQAHRARPLPGRLTWAAGRSSPSRSASSRCSPGSRSTSLVARGSRRPHARLAARARDVRVRHRRRAAASCPNDELGAVPRHRGAPAPPRGAGAPAACAAAARRRAAGGRRRCSASGVYAGGGAGRAHGDALGRRRTPGAARRPPRRRRSARCRSPSTWPTPTDRVRLRFKRPPRAGLLVNLDTGEVLWRRNPDRALPIASLTKMMTALVAVRRARGRRQGADHQRGARLQRLGRRRPAPGQAREGRDAAPRPHAPVGQRRRARARLPDERQHRRVRAAHERAGRARSACGCTRFASSRASARATAPAPPTSRSSPGACSTRRGSRGSSAARRAILPFPIKGGRVHLYNNNPLLRRGYPGIIGVKTGYTDEAGRCLVAAARRNGARLAADRAALARPRDAGAPAARPRLPRAAVNRRGRPAAYAG